MIPVVLSGGSGTRLWPVSRQKFPKQFCELFEDSLQNLTLHRVSKFGNPIIITSKLLRDFTEKKAIEAGFKNIEVVYEPLSRNTAPAVAMLCHILKLRGQEKEIIGIFPADHLIEKEDVFAAALDLSIQAAKMKKVVTLGLKPKSPETGYGYIQTRKQPMTFNHRLAGYEVIRFHEKPNRELAQQFITEGSFYWNAGIFIFSVEHMIELLQRFQPQIWKEMSRLNATLSNLNEVYSNLPSISLDYAIMERLGADEMVCVPCDLDWSDVGSWDSVASVYEKSGKSKGEPLEVNSKNNFVIPQGHKRYAFVGTDDLIVVDTADALLVVKRGHSQEVKTIVDRLNREKSKLTTEHQFEERPWGRFDILSEEQKFKSKIIRVNSHSQISYQSHAKREEHWIIVQGQGVVTIDEKEQIVKPGSYIKVPLGAKHRIKNSNSEPLLFIEVQLGSYFGEDDIKRYQDDYHRME